MDLEQDIAAEELRIMMTKHEWRFIGFFQNANHFRCNKCGKPIATYSNIHPSIESKYGADCSGSPVGTTARPIIEKAAARLKGVLT
jgi:hypothetical protein